MKTTWRLPRGVDELLPPDAWALEGLRRRVLDVFDQRGFEYVEPPVIEYLESLLVGGGEDLDLQTLKVVDQISGRQLGVRADMTAQAVRVDAHARPRDGIQRFCYAGPVVFANPRVSQTSRVPFKVGAELFGSSDLAADVEIVDTMLAAVAEADVEQPVLLLGHMGVYRALVASLGVSPDVESRVFSAVQRKSQSDVAALLPESAEADMMIELPLLMGEPGVLAHARTRLKHANEAVAGALDDLEALVNGVRATHAEIELRLDLAELYGYGYHNGPVFAVFHPEHGKALAQGGRYDGVGGGFGRARPATGFDMNLKNLTTRGAPARDLIFAPPGADASLASEVDRLRAAGRRVLCALAEGEIPPPEATHRLVGEGAGWRVETI